MCGLRMTSTTLRYFRTMKEPKTSASLNVLFMNARFPTSLDLAWRLGLAGHTVFVVDCMHYHICKFSIDVRRSYCVPIPHDNPSAFVSAV